MSENLSHLVFLQLRRPLRLSELDFFLSLRFKSLQNLAWGGRATGDGPVS